MPCLHRVGGARCRCPHSPPRESSQPGGPQGAPEEEDRSNLSLPLRGSLTPEGRQAFLGLNRLPCKLFSPQLSKCSQGSRPQTSLWAHKPPPCTSPQTVWTPWAVCRLCQPNRNHRSEELPGWGILDEAQCPSVWMGKLRPGGHKHDIKDSGLSPVKLDPGFPGSRSSYCTKQKSN